MKKLFILTVLAIASFSNASAQVTWNVRVGGGAMKSYSYYVDWYDIYEYRNEGAFVLALESNIPFKRGGNFCFSPSVMGIIGSESQEIVSPLLVGYKVKISQNSLLIPKVGVTAGAYIYGEASEVVGPSVALSYEYKHFIMGFNGFFNVLEDVGSSYSFTLGYKF